MSQQNAEAAEFVAESVAEAFRQLQPQSRPLQRERGNSPLVDPRSFESRRETQKWEVRALSEVGQPDDVYRAALIEINQADEDLAGLQAHLRKLNAEIDDAVNHHAAVTEPLQAELANASTG